MDNLVVSEKLQPGSNLDKKISCFRLGHSPTLGGNILQRPELRQLQDQEDEAGGLERAVELDNILVIDLRESPVKFDLPLSVLYLIPLLVAGENFPPDAFHGKLLSSDPVGEKISPGERSFSQEFSSLVDLDGSAGSVVQESWRSDVSVSGSWCQKISN